MPIRRSDESGSHTGKAEGVSSQRFHGALYSDSWYFIRKATGERHKGVQIFGARHRHQAFLFNYECRGRCVVLGRFCALARA